MPMSFPNYDSLRLAADVHKFRCPTREESEAHYREALADHVKPIDLIESGEIRTGKGWDEWNDTEKAQIMG